MFAGLKPPPGAYCARSVRIRLSGVKRLPESCRLVVHGRSRLFASPAPMPLAASPSIRYLVCSLAAGERHYVQFLDAQTLYRTSPLERQAARTADL